MEEYITGDASFLGQYLEEFDKQEELRQEEKTNQKQSEDKQTKQNEVKDNSFGEYDNEDLLEI